MLSDDTPLSPRSRLSLGWDSWRRLYPAICIWDRRDGLNGLSRVYVRGCSRFCREILKSQICSASI